MTNHWRNSFHLALENIQSSEESQNLRIKLTLICFNAKLRSLIDHVIYKPSTYFMIDSTEFSQDNFPIDL